MCWDLTFDFQQLFIYFVWFCLCVEKQLESIANLFVSLMHEGLNSRRLCVFFVVLLMHEDLSCWSSFKYFVVMWMCGSKKLEVTWGFFRFYWCMKATIHKLHDLCGCVDMRRFSMLASFLQLCQFLQLFILCNCVDMKKKQQRCIGCYLQEWYDSSKRAHYEEFKKKSVIDNEKTIAYWCWGHLISTFCFLWSISHWKPEIVYSCNIEK